MGEVPPRSLSEDEHSVVARLINLGGLKLTVPITVVGKCECGCASIDFEPNKAGPKVLVDGYGRTAAGIEVGVLLWGYESSIAGLEVYMLGTDTGELPAPESLHLGGSVRAS